MNNLDAATNVLVDELNTLTERQAQLKERTTMKLSPLYSSGVSCGFPSPADDHQGQPFSLDEHLITNPAATYMSRANGDSMLGVVKASIHNHRGD